MKPLLLIALLALVGCATPTVRTLDVSTPTGKTVHITLADAAAWSCTAPEPHTMRCTNTSDRPQAAIVGEARAIVEPGVTMIVAPKGLAL
jgi:hypothetical protein